MESRDLLRNPPLVLPGPGETSSELRILWLPGHPLSQAITRGDEQGVPIRPGFALV
jgi:hypothetical protein